MEQLKSSKIIVIKGINLDFIELVLFVLLMLRRYFMDQRKKSHRLDYIGINMSSLKRIEKTLL